MKTNNIEIEAYIYEIKTNKIILKAKENYKSKHVETILIDKLNEQNKSKEENKKYGIFVTLCPCPSCLQYIALNRLKEIKFKLYNNLTSSREILLNSIQNKTVIKKIKEDGNEKTIQNIIKLLR
jgi:tRNA(Arg) A34 adenosine deaminase TadA